MNNIFFPLFWLGPRKIFDLEKSNVNRDRKKERKKKSNSAFMAVIFGVKYIHFSGTWKPKRHSTEVFLFFVLAFH